MPTCEHCNEERDDVRGRTPGDFNAADLCDDCAAFLIEGIAVPTACACGACGPCRNARLMTLYWGREWWGFDTEAQAFALLSLEESEGEPIALLDAEDAA